MLRSIWFNSSGNGVVGSYNNFDSFVNPNNFGRRDRPYLQRRGRGRVRSFFAREPVEDRVDQAGHLRLPHGRSRSGDWQYTPWPTRAGELSQALDGPPDTVHDTFDITVSGRPTARSAPRHIDITVHGRPTMAPASRSQWGAVGTGPRPRATIEKCAPPLLIAPSGDGRRSGFGRFSTVAGFERPRSRPKRQQAADLLLEIPQSGHRRRPRSASSGKTRWTLWRSRHPGTFSGGKTTGGNAAGDHVQQPASGDGPLPAQALVEKYQLFPNGSECAFGPRRRTGERFSLVDGDGHHQRAAHDTGSESATQSM